MTSAEPVLPRIRPEIAALPPYRQGRPADPDGYKLSSNENPFEPLPGVVEAARAAVDFNRYPDATAASLREALGARHGVSPEAVLIGAGSVSLLQAFIQAAATVGDEVVYSWRSFEAYPSLVLVAGASGVQVPGLPDGRHDLDAMAAAVTPRTRVVLLCTPNNPTGPVITRAEFADFVAKVPADVLILLDEAYAEFVRSTATGTAAPVNGLADRVYEAHPNVVVLRTFSKAYGLAALRVGYAIGHPRVLDGGRSTVTPLSVTASAVAAAVASLAHQAELDERVDEIVARRTTLVAGLREIGWDVPDAQGNFVWLPASPHVDSTSVAEAFDAAGIIVRPFPEGVRISIGEHESVEKVLGIARSVVPSLPSV
ncbi:histidinol-phosphate transaminase [Microbacterium marinilacus]|uniref:Aromatic amino acid aminotransferase n=1 Tax=Microbacterium marinilacus TaxID=415209 RepID=A0ABP7BRE8_9MICO|nr:histidinol-phosphate transaminase [Microbacterium marinilacus]MBY0689165.1 histidinol-phosphate transaminase [Microbacterium marinilacus]